MDEPAVRVDSVSKNFKLPHEKQSSLKSLFVNVFKRQKGYELQQALKDISFEIKKGEFFGIVGRNGSGKSTLLKIIAGIYQPTQGSVGVNGKLVPFIELGVGFNPELSGRENVYLNGALLGFSNKEVAKMYNDIVEFAELERFMDQKLKNYSSGMQVRLAFSMAVRAEADVLVIDEVLAVGDAAFQRKCFEYFKTLKKNKKTVVFVSHDMSAVQEFCDRAALVEKSELKSIGDTLKITREYSDLFLEEDSSDKRLNNLVVSKRQGTGAAQITDVSLNKGSFNNKDESIEIRVELEAKGQTNLLMTGFAVRDSQGLLINGAHTWAVQDDLKVEPGKKCKVVWTLPNIYEDGFHTVDVYIWGGGHEVLDSIEEAISFRVKRSSRSGCLVSPPVNVSINNGSQKKIR